MILLTGVSGFIGKFLIRALVSEYGKEHIIALTSTPISECRFLLHHNYTFDKDYFVKFGFEKITTIIHAGAFTPKDGNQANEWKNCINNISSTGVLLSAEFPSIEKFIYLSTLDVYADAAVLSEESAVEPISLYGYSKLYSEKMIEAWGNEQKKIIQILRIGHVYGPGEEAYQKVIPVTIKKLLNEQSLQIWGTGEAIRSFINVKDVVSAILKSIKLQMSIGPTNIVSNRQITIIELVNKLIEISGKSAKIDFLNKVVQDRNLIFDNTKMRTLLLPTEIKLEEGLLEEWEYLKYKD